MRRRRHIQLWTCRQEDRDALQGGIGERGMNGVPQYRPRRVYPFRSRQLRNTAGRPDAHALDSLKGGTVGEPDCGQSLVDVFAVKDPVELGLCRNIDPQGPQIRLDQPAVGMCRPQLGMCGAAVDGEPLGGLVHGETGDRRVMFGDHQRHREDHRVQARLAPAGALTHGR